MRAQRTAIALLAIVGIFGSLLPWVTLPSELGPEWAVLFPKPGRLPLGISILAMLAALLGERAEPLGIRPRLLVIACGVGLAAYGISKLSKIQDLLHEMASGNHYTSAMAARTSIEAGLYLMIVTGILSVLIGIFSLSPPDPVNPNQD